MLTGEQLACGCLGRVGRAVTVEHRDGGDSKAAGGPVWRRPGAPHFRALDGGGWVAGIEAAGIAHVCQMAARHTCLVLIHNAIQGMEAIER
jgi:hypothetical protein